MEWSILFMGPVGAGKTQAIQSISEIEVVNTDMRATDETSQIKSHTTVAMDVGVINVSTQDKVRLYGAPGQDRFDFMWGVICKGAIGTIILIDHTIENPLKDLQFYIDTFKAHGENITIGITHVDEDQSKSTHQYREWLIENNLTYPLFFIDARKQDDVLMLIETLITSLEVKYL